MENAAQISGKDILHIALSKMLGSPITSAYKLRHCLPHLIWRDLKSELLRQYSTILLNSHGILAFAHLQQGSDELLEMYILCASELLLKIHHTTNMFLIPAEGLNHYTMVYDLNPNTLKNKVAGH